MKRLLLPHLNPAGYMAAAGAVYAAAVMLWNAAHHHGVVSVPVIVAAIAAVAALLTRQVVTPVADPRNGAGVPLLLPLTPPLPSRAPQRGGYGAGEVLVESLPPPGPRQTATGGGDAVSVSEEPAASQPGPVTTAGVVGAARGIGHGIDISSFQGNFDWAAWKDRLDFAGIRITSWTGAGTFAPDPELDRNAHHTWEVFGGKIPRLFYHYSRPGLHAPHVQARLAREALGGHLCRGDILVDDMEENDGEPPAFVSRWHRRFLDEWDRIAPGHRVLPYCSTSWADAGNCAGLEAWELWLASWGAGDSPRVPAPWTAYRFLQTGGANLDRDIFAGSPAELLTWCRMPSWRR